MGFSTPQYLVSEYIKWTHNGTIQLPDFQRGYKWEDDRIRQLLITILRGHPMGIVMLLKTGNESVRFKPKPLEGTAPADEVEAQKLLLDGQQRLTSLSQALVGTGVVATKDSRGKLLDRRYYVHMETAIQGEDRVDEAVISVPADGVVRSNFGRTIELDLSTPELEREHGYFPLRLLYQPDEVMTWMFALGNIPLAQQFNKRVLGPVASYTIPAIELDQNTSKSAVATVFEKVNTGGMPLNVFELLTAMFAGDAAYYDRTGEDFRLSDDWHAAHQQFAAEPAIRGVSSTDFLQAITLVVTRAKNLADSSSRPPAISAKRDDILELQLDDYLIWRDKVRDAFLWVATFLADQHVFDARFLPYATQLVPLAVIRTILGTGTDLHSARQRITEWFWCGVLGELYGGATETRFARDVEQVPAWAQGDEGAAVPRTVSDASFQESRLYTLRTRGSAAYKGIYALLIGEGAKDWMFDQSFGKVQYTDLKTDIHHIFPYKWCIDNKIDPVLRESIVNKTALAATTNRTIGAAAPSKYLRVIEDRSKVDESELDALLRTHLVDPDALRADDFDAHFAHRKEAVLHLIENAMGKPLQREASVQEPARLADDFEEESADLELENAEDD
ncbi:DUF262 domain-containing protein [Humibacter albus]|uniref:DUF262 domain-containing protein n=1 Tax=Humibacter albus TaxID=427754 RepID=UPI0003B5C2A4|nr:DUF262 domain-containing protein [Humibacter albus]